jgi:HSP20 family molecular chaperone IbpA
MSDQTNSGTALVARPETSPARWNPWQEFDQLRQRMDDLFSRSFGYTPLSRMVPAEWQANEPLVDIHETEDTIEVLAPLPGYTSEQIDIQATANTLHIQAAREALKSKDKGVSHRDNGVTEASQ